MKQLKGQLISQSRLFKKYPEIIAGFTTRFMGDMRGLEELGELERLGKTINFPYNNFCLMGQIHSDNITVVKKSGIFKNTDGMITQERDLILLTIVADCLPILFYEKSKNIIGVCHAGRKGTELKISEKMVRKILSLGGESKKLIVVIGPHIHKCCYSVDLTKENKKQLLMAGVKEENLEIFKECTCCGRNFFSYRREGKDFQEFAGFIGMLCAD